VVEENPEEFSKKVELLLNNPELLKMMQKNAKIKAQEFSIEKSAIKLEELYRELIKNKEK